MLTLNRVQFTIGSIQAFGYSANEKDINGNFINYLSGFEMADMIGLHDTTTLQNRMSADLKALLGPGFTTLQGKYKNSTNAYTKINCWTTQAASAYFLYHVSKGNAKAMEILLATSSASIDLIINDEFNRTYHRGQQQKIVNYRAKTIESFWYLTDEIKAWLVVNGLQNSPNAKFYYMNSMKEANKGLFNMGASEIKAELGLRNSEFTRNHFGAEALRRLDIVQSIAAPMIKNGVKPQLAVKQAVSILSQPVIDFRL